MRDLVLGLRPNAYKKLQYHIQTIEEWIQIEERGQPSRGKQAALPEAQP